MIPKIIHYCWINDGNEGDFPQIVKDCIDSWKRILPDYEIKEWNINNFDINKNNYIKEAYKMKKYAFVSDYIRLYVLYNYGGIYMDTDVKVLKSLNRFLNEKAFMGFESLDRVATCIIGAEKGSLLIKDMLNLYNNKNFIKKNGEMDLTPNTVLIKPILKKNNILFNNILQKKENIVIYPSEFFCPLNGLTGELKITDNSYAIHLFNGSWISKTEKDRLNLCKKYYFKLRKILPIKLSEILAKGFATYKIEGFSGLKKRIYKKLKYYEKRK
ncbi:MAG: glycosyltransferase [Megamonas funiformis]|uniref:glycosyltransferase family 32 protein n=1 Tax=Megamonas funiformis TaxID=437897 RepID=UPI002A8044FF|nr:glycosyltransferase [Megamonas funiformis]MDY3874179.1 glycosyltransferase [Megamonas funiformis]